MLHVTTEVGKPGIIDREKRHFPELLNQPGVSKYYPRGRRYIPHGFSEEYQFKPHPEHIAPKFTDVGPDWKSRIRPIATPPHSEEYPVTENWPGPWKALRTYPGTSTRTDHEWLLYSEGPGYDSTLRSTWDGIHKASTTSEKEVTHSMRFGKGRIVVNKRNGIPRAAPGDKSYQVVEYSPEFHKGGSTLPLVNFGGNAAKKADTFVPLVELPPIPRESYKTREQMRRMMQEVEDVMTLENWRPASPLTVPTNNLHGQSNQAQQSHSGEAMEGGTNKTVSLIAK